VFTYVANLAGDSLSAYIMQRGSSPVLQNLSGVHTIATPTPSALAADGRYLWVTSHGQSTVSAFVVNDESGELTPAGTPVASGGTAPTAIAVHPNHSRLYVVNAASDSIQMFGIDTESGELTPIGSPLASAVTSGKAMLVAPSGSFGFALSASGSLTRLAVNATTGALSIDGVTSIPGVSTCYNMTLHPNSLTLYVACSGSTGSSVHALVVDANGVLTPGSSVPVGTPSVLGIAIEPSGAWLHAVHLASDSVSTFSVDGSGALAFSNTASTGDGPVAIAIAP
jgi:6-phosphogluconolactonase (cycloisomerase 2 family)